uniref:Uncharacterized protein n=1 Tax=Zosterops lateralis melanops TaxID=1220523 RepID=A0A8D2PIV4_ZOSLA
MKLSSGMKKLAAQRPTSTSSFRNQNLQAVNISRTEPLTAPPRDTSPSPVACPYPLWSCARQSELERTFSSRAACARWKQAVPKQTRYTAEEPTSCSQSLPPGRCWPWQVAWIWASMRGTWGLHMVSP